MSERTLSVGGATGASKCHGMMTTGPNVTFKLVALRFELLRFVREKTTKSVGKLPAPAHLLEYLGGIVANLIPPAFAVARGDLLLHFRPRNLRIRMRVGIAAGTGAQSEATHAAVLFGLHSRDRHVFCGFRMIWFEFSVAGKFFSFVGNSPDSFSVTSRKPAIGKSTGCSR